MNIGITFEEKILNEISLKEYINFIKNNNITFLEFAPNIEKYGIEFYNNIFNLLKNLNINIHYHLPHFINRKLDVTNFKKENIQEFINYYNIISNFERNNKSANLIFHGAKYENIAKDQALNKTLDFIDFTIKFFDENKIDISLLIETLNKKKNKVIGDNRYDLVKICEKYKKLNICWDMTHDFLNNNKIIKPSSIFLNKVGYCHIHGFNLKKSHIPLNTNNLLNDYIKISLSKKFNLNIELLFCENYISELKKDINFIKVLNKKND